MAAIAHFLSTLEPALLRLQQRIKSDGSDSSAVRILPDRARVVAADEVAIGTGKFEVPASDAPPLTGICLNDKLAGRALKSSPGFGSVTDLVLNAPPALFDQWRTIVGPDASPEAFFGRFTLIVEDASPDSCFGLICFLMRIGGIAVDSIPQEWVKYVEGWERGHIVVSVDIYGAYGCLHNALVHGKIDDDIAGAWLDGLHLMRDALASGAPPVALPPTIPSPVFSRARALLRFEQQSYEETLEHATLIQLSLPIAQTKKRYRLVDAYLTEMTLPLGSLKVFTRTDRTRPFLKNGYTLMAVYRTKPEGDGDDMTISVDQAATVELRDLWLNLEQAEDQAWGADRPHDDPRRDLIGYQNGKRPDGTNAPNQPWYDGRDYTLLAAPRKLGVGRLGSKLGWQDVLEVLWQTYQPFRHVKVRPGAIEAAVGFPPSDEKLKSLEDCYPEVLSDDVEDRANTPLLFVAGWYRPDSSAPAFNVTPTFCKYLAACIKRWRPPEATSPIALSELPDETAYDLLKLPGMIAIISSEGAFLVYDGQRLKPPLHEMRSEFERAVKIRQGIERGASDLAVFLDDIGAYFSGKRRDLIEDDLLQRLTTEQIEIALELHRAHSAVVSHEARRFREAVLERWGIESWLNSLANDITQIKNVLYGRADIDNARRVAFMHKYGVPVALAALVYGFGLVAETLWHWPLKLSGVKWSGLFILLLLASAIFGLIEVGRRWRRRGRLKSIAALNIETFSRRGRD